RVVAWQEVRPRPVPILREVAPGGVVPDEWSSDGFGAEVTAADRDRALVIQGGADLLDDGCAQRRQHACEHSNPGHDFHRPIRRSRSLPHIALHYLRFSVYLRSGSRATITSGCTRSVPLECGLGNYR